MTEILKSTSKVATAVLDVVSAATTSVVQSVNIVSSPVRFLGKTIGFFTDNVSGLDEKKEKSPSFSDYLLEGGSNKRKLKFRLKLKSKSKSKSKKSRSLKIKFKPRRKPSRSLKLKRVKRKSPQKHNY
jgi:hypothetical protein